MPILRIPPDVNSGERPKAEYENMRNEAFREIERRLSGTTINTPQEKGVDPDAIVAEVHNATGGDVDIGYVGGIDGWAGTDDDSSRKILSLVTPDTDSHTGKFAIFNDVMENGEVARKAIIFGLALVQINVTDENHKYADITDGDCTMLTSAESGAALILDRDGGTGTQWAIVRLGGGAGGASSNDPPRLYIATSDASNGEIEAERLNSDGTGNAGSGSGSGSGGDVYKVYTDEDAVTDDILIETLDADGETRLRKLGGVGSGDSSDPTEIPFNTTATADTTAYTSIPAHGLSRPCVTGASYSAADKTFYIMYRLEVYDSLGNLVSVGAENKQAAINFSSCT